MVQKLNKRRVEAAKLGTTIWDGEIPGFGLRVTKRGARSYVLKYRRGTLQRWITIGRHGAPWTPETARREARKLLSEIAAGKDPALERMDDRASPSFSAFANTYLADHAMPHKRPSSVSEDRRNLKNHIVPVFGSQRVKDITRVQISRFHKSMKDTPFAANRCLALLSHMFKMAELWGIRPDNSNPTTHVKKFEEKARSRFLTKAEIARLGRVLRFLNGKQAAPYEVAAIQLLMFTGARLSEILTLRWQYVDFNAQLLRLPDSKSGEKTIALSAPALTVLVGLKRLADNPYVICGRKEGAHLVNLQKPWRRIRKAALLSDVRLHDLRHSFASIAAEGGMSLPLIGSLLGHSQPQTTQRYAHLAYDPRLSAAESIASEIEATMRGESAQIIRLTR